MLSQISIKKEVEQILQVTKKKKNKDKQNLYYHEVFNFSVNEDYGEILENRDTITRFNKDFTEKQNKERIGNENHFSGYLSIFEDVENEGK